MDLKKELKKCNVIQHGTFTLKSGEKTNIYIDMRNVISYPHVHEYICEQIINKIGDISQVDRICGTPYGAISYASNISIMKSIPMIFMRKEEKEHGTKKLIEGEYNPGDRVVLIEDVTTTGSSVFEAAEKLESAGLVVCKIICILSRHPDRVLVYKNKVILDHLLYIDDIIETNKVRQLIDKKKSNICLAADVGSMEELLDLIEKVGDKIAVLKLHADIISDFHSNFYTNCTLLRQLKDRYNFIIWEDRKLADIGSIMQKQVNIIKNWADIVSMHPIAGLKSVESIEGIDIVLVVEMSTEGNFINHNYRLDAVQTAERCSNVIGVVSQHKVSSKLLHFVPGISLSSEKDDRGQKYSNPSSRDFADLFVVGRGIYESDDPSTAIDKYLDITMK